MNGSLVLIIKLQACRKRSVVIRKVNTLQQRNRHQTITSFEMSTGHKRKKIRMVLCSYPGAADASNDTVQRVRSLSEDLFAYNEIYSDGGDIGYSQSRRKFRVAIDSDDLKS